MRRLLLILLLAFMPLQSIWAAAASYCGHESAASTHFGHHQHLAHDHVAQTTDDGKHDGAAGARGAGVDMDCHVCHGIGTGLHGGPAATALSAARMAPAPFALPLLRAPTPLRPERPNWPALA